MATVYIPTLLRHLADGIDHVQIPGQNIGEVIDGLDSMYPGFKKRLIDGDEIHAEIAVVIDQEVMDRDLLEVVHQNSNVYFVPSVSGGSTLIENVFVKSLDLDRSTHVAYLYESRSMFIKCGPVV
jgi:molybdopterin converting factor small subunit